jgi:hypothetical protein
LRAVRLFAIALVSAALAACQPDGSTEFAVTFDPCEPHVLVVAADASADELASIDQALAMWREAAGTRVVRAAAGDGVGLRFEEASPAFRGIYLDDAGDIVINRLVTDREARAITVAHELGHAFGLHHRAAPVSVMNPGNLAIAPNQADAAELVAAWGECGDVEPPSRLAPRD